MRLVPAARAALCDLFTATGPSAPTVLPGWRAEDLLAHLLVRERRPWAAVGILLTPLAGLAEAAMSAYTGLPWERRVALLRGGAPPWSAFRLAPLDERGNLVEFHVHHEDLARAQPGWSPRPGEEDREEALWSALRLSARVLYRHSPVGVVLRHPGRDRGTTITARRGPDPVTVTGPPGELVLHAFGRDRCQVEVTGEDTRVQALRATPRGF
jgi:uncharacterized protein (TIGR03085 family)